MGFFESFSADVAAHPGAVRFAFSTYCCLEYVSGFLMWAGSRNLTTGAPLSRGAWVLIPPLAFGAVAPWLLPTTDHVYVFHAPIFGMFFLPLRLRRDFPREKFGDGFPEFTDSLP